MLITEDLDKNEFFAVETSKTAVIDIVPNHLHMKNGTIISEIIYQRWKLSLNLKMEKTYLFEKNCFPVVLANKSSKINAKIVKENLLLLDSKTPLKKEKTVWSEH